MVGGVQPNPARCGLDSAPHCSACATCLRGWSAEWVFCPQCGRRLPAYDAGSAPPTDPGPIDHNLYCLRCGYNLRGLSGDPVRCPEC